MVYLVIKELAKVAEDVIIVTSSLQKDMNAKTETIYRANAIRALAKITDVRGVQWHMGVGCHHTDHGANSFVRKGVHSQRANAGAVT